MWEARVRTEWRIGEIIWSGLKSIWINIDCLVVEPCSHWDSYEASFVYLPSTKFLKKPKEIGPKYLFLGPTLPAQLFCNIYRVGVTAARPVPCSCETARKTVRLQPMWLVFWTETLPGRSPAHTHRRASLRVPAVPQAFHAEEQV